MKFNIFENLSFRVNVVANAKNGPEIKKNELGKKSESLNVRSQNDLRAKKSLKEAKQPIKMVHFNSAGYQFCRMAQLDINACNPD